MRCKECGREIEDGSRYCPWCGADTPWEVPSGPHKRRVTAVAAAALAVVIVAILAVALGSASNNTQGLDFNVPNDGGSSAVVFTEGVYYYDGDDSDLFTFELEEEGGVRTLRITLDESVSSEYPLFIWYVYENQSWPWSYKNIEKEEGELFWTLSDDTVGDFTVGVFCGRYDGPHYEVDVKIDGIMTASYDWSYQGERYGLSVDYMYSYYLDSSGPSGASLQMRSGYGNGTYSVMSEFMVVDEPVSDIAGGLHELYLERYGEEDGQGYAEFILAFVQECFSYTYDYVLYGTEEYYAFPIETIHNGGGDCEDTAILCASIYEAAGYDAGVFVIPGHAVAAVALEEYEPTPVVNPVYAGTVEVFCQTVDGVTYYGCETTLSTNGYGVGWISSDYSIDTDGTIWYEGEAYRDGNYGLILAVPENRSHAGAPGPLPYAVRWTDRSRDS